MKGFEIRRPRGWAKKLVQNLMIVACKIGTDDTVCKGMDSWIAVATAEVPLELGYIQRQLPQLYHYSFAGQYSKDNVLAAKKFFRLR